MTTQLAPPAVFRAFDNSGHPLAGGQLFTYIAGTTTPQTTYIDSTQTTQNTNPVILNARGEANVWLVANFTYKLALYDAVGTLIWSVDQITGGLSATSIGALLYPQTAAEVAGGVTPSNNGYPTLPFADVRRYGCKCDGVTDDTAALQTAFDVAATEGLALVLPYGYSCLITSYVQIFSNTTFYLLGTLQLNNREAGLYTQQANNVSIYGNKIGLITDSSVVANYIWNDGPNYAPVIHMRASTNCLVDGVNISYTAAGVRFSNSTQNWLPGVNWTYTLTPLPLNCKVQNCNIQFTEYGAITGTNLQHCIYADNYVYRCGDGGIYIITGSDCDIVRNHRVSPKTVYADTQTYGLNVLAHPTTWQDQQGIEIQFAENCLIADNLVENFSHNGIDVKEYCNRVVIARNRIENCEQCSISVREGDAGNTGYNGKITIQDNIISNHGYVMEENSVLWDYSAAIGVDSTFIVEVIDNIIYSYQLTPGIVCNGPGAWTDGFSSFTASSVVITGNCIEFDPLFPSVDNTEFLYTSATLGAIVIGGATESGGAGTSNYVSVKCDNNHIRTDRYAYADVRAASAPAISLTYNTSNSLYYPTSASISNNEIIGWGATGIYVQGLAAMALSGLAVNSNVVAGAGGNGIQLNQTSWAVCNNNQIAENNSTSATSYGIQLTGSAGTALTGVVCTGNSISGSQNRGGNALAYGLAISYATNINAKDNVIAGYTSGVVTLGNVTGDILLQGTVAPRSSAGSPVGSVTSYYTGEMYLDTATSTWYFATAGNATTWNT